MMLGHLVPCGGGQALPLAKERLKLGRRKPVPDPAGSSTNDIELQFVNGWWYVQRLDASRPLSVNGNECDSARLKPNDVLAVGGKFYRIAYQAPESAVKPRCIQEASPTESPAPRADLPHAPVPAPRAPEKSRAPTSTSALGTLIPCGGGPPVPLRSPRFVIGRAPTCDLVLAYRSTSAKHCALELHRGYWQMTDLDSTNGTTVDGMTYRRKWILPGSILGLPGKRYRLEYQPHGELPSLTDDDEIVVPNRSLLEMAGIVERLVNLLPNDDQPKPRWKLE